MKKSETYMMIIGSSIVLGFFGLLALLVFLPVKSANESLLNIAVGGLIGQFATIVGYYFGSSQGSRIKTGLMAENAKNTNENLPAE